MFETLEKMEKIKQVDRVSKERFQPVQMEIQPFDYSPEEAEKLDRTNYEVKRNINGYPFLRT